MAHVSAPALFALIILCCFSPGVHSNTLSFVVSNQHEQPLADAVVELIAPQPAASTTLAQASVAQQGLMFTPFVTAVARGSKVDFPNQDKTRHHVYSFSAAKTFEIQLYSGKPEQPVLFDQAGIVVLGCNIHDYMQAYIYVGDSPLLAVTTADGSAVFTHLPAGDYRIKLWHPWQLQPVAEQQLSVSASRSVQLQLPVADNSKPSAPKRGFGG